MAVEELNYFKNEILPTLKDNFPTCVIDDKKSSSKEIVLRLNILSDEKAENFKKVFSAVTNTEWIVYRSASNFQRVATLNLKPNSLIFPDDPSVNITVYAHSHSPNGTSFEENLFGNLEF